METTMADSASFSNHLVAVYRSPDQAEGAIRFLRNCGHEIKHLSIIGQEYATEERPIGFINTGDRMLSWGKFGAYWGSIWGLLFGSAMLFVPGLGYILFGGWLVAALEGAAVGGGIAALGAALASIGMPSDEVRTYQQALHAGRFLVVVHGTEADVRRVKVVLSSTPATSIEAFSTQKVAGFEKTAGAETSHA